MKPNLKTLDLLYHKKLITKRSAGRFMSVLIFTLTVAVTLSAFEVKQNKSIAAALEKELVLAEEAQFILDKYSKKFMKYEKSISMRNPTRVRWREYLEKKFDAAPFRDLQFAIGSSQSFNRVYKHVKPHKVNVEARTSEIRVDQHLLRIVGDFNSDRKLVELLYALQQIPGELIKHHGCKTSKTQISIGYELECLYMIYNVDLITN